MPSKLPNPAGELEREARSPRANVIDALGVACLILFALWPFGFGVGVLHRNNTVHGVAEGMLRLGMLWAFVGSALWHRDSAESLGLSTPGRVWRLIRESAGVARLRLVTAVSAVFLGVMGLGLSHWPLAARFLQLPKAYRVWPETAGQWGAMLLFLAVVAFLFATCAVRYDNARPAFGFAGKAIVVLFAFAAAAGWLADGPQAFAWLLSPRLPLELTGYAFWGFFQQLIFTAYFATRLRKGFGGLAAHDVTNRMESSGGDLLRATAMGGLFAALTLAPAFWAALRFVHGPAVSPEVLLVATVFAFPVGAVWMRFYRLAPRRMLVATLSGSFFGIIHANSYGLVLATTMLGAIFAYAAMEDRFRNLAAFALMHGVLGTCLSKTFQHAGALKIDFRVGPWNVPHPHFSALIIPTLYLAGYATLALLAARNSRLSAAQP